MVLKRLFNTWRTVFCYRPPKFANFAKIPTRIFRLAQDRCSVIQPEFELQDQLPLSHLTKRRGDRQNPLGISVSMVSTFTETQPRTSSASAAPLSRKTKRRKSKFCKFCENSWSLDDARRSETEGDWGLRFGAIGAPFDRNKHSTVHNWSRSRLVLLGLYEKRKQLVKNIEGKCLP